MDKLLKLADEFLSLSKEAKRGRKPKKLRNRKDVEKDLVHAKKRYSKSKGDVDYINDQMSKLKAQLEKSTHDMNDARDCMVNSHKALKGMDLSGASMIQGDGNDVSYVIDKKRYDISFSDDGSFELIPSSAKKKDANSADDETDTDEDGDDNEADDSLDFSDSNNSSDINWAKDFENIFKI